MVRKCLSRFGTLLISLAIFSSSTADGQSPPIEVKSVPAEDETQTTLTESLGLFASLQLYNTYLNIGILADAMTEGMYEARDVYQLLGSVVHPLDRVEKQLDKLAKLKLSKDDLDALAKMKKISTLLRQQGKELDLFWDKGKPENSKNYETARQAAWKELNALLELEPKEERLATPPRSASPTK